MAEIRLAHDKGVALIDDEDVQRIPMTGWYLHPGGYAARQPLPSGESLLHRIVINAPKGSEVDHRNRNKLDCRKSNLRFVTRSQNNQNRRGPMKRNRLGIRGVSAQFNKGGTVSYFARVQIDGKYFYRCGFQTAAEAEVAAIELRRMYFTHSQECG